MVNGPQRPDLVERVQVLNAQRMTDRQIAKELGLHHKTVAAYRAINGLRPNGQARSYLCVVAGDNARCSRCGEVSPLASWPTASDGSGRYLLSYCRACRRRQGQDAVNSSVAANLKMRFSRLKVRASKLGIPFDISMAEFEGRWEAQRGLCFYTDVLLQIEVGNGAAANTFSVDKIEPARGYVGGNVVFAAYRVNTIKRDMTLAEMRDWTPGWYARVIEMWRARGIPCAQVAEGDF